MCGDPFNICLLIWVAKLEMSHVLQSNKIKSYRGRSDRLSVYINGFLVDGINPRLALIITAFEMVS